MVRYSISIFAILQLWIIGCDKSDDGDTKTGTASATLVAANSLALGGVSGNQFNMSSIEKQQAGGMIPLAASSITSSGNACGTKSDGTANTFWTGEAQDTWTGSPSSFKVTLTKIVISGSDVTSTIYEDSAGVELTMTTGVIDLGGVSLSGAATVGTYNKIALYFKNEAKITGCVRADWNSQTATTEGYSDSRSAGIDTFCTKADYSVFDKLNKDGTNTNVPRSIYHIADDSTALNTLAGSSAAEVSAPIGKGITDKTVVLTDKSAEVVVYANTAEFAVAEGATAAFTVLFDNNRILGFESNARTDGTHQFYAQSADSGFGQSITDDRDAAFFYINEFDSSILAVPGEVGSVQGYQMQFCYDYNGDSSDKRAADGWLTLMLDGDSNILGGNVIPIDRTGFVILLGSIGSYTAGTSTFGSGVSAPSKNGDGTWNLYFNYFGNSSSSDNLLNFQLQSTATFGTYEDAKGLEYTGSDITPKQSSSQNTKVRAYRWL